MRLLEEYQDRVSYYVEVAEIALRPGSVETNRYRSEYYGARYYEKGVWYISSSSTGLRLAWKGPLRTAWRPRPLSKGLAEAPMFQGNTRLGEYRELDEDTVREYVETIGSLEGDGCRLESVATFVHESRSITHPQGIAREEKNYTDVLVAAKCGKASLSARIGFLGSLDSQRLRSIASITENLVYDTMAYRGARSLSPMATGKWHVILSGDAAGALLHELGHLLEAGTPGSLSRGEIIGPRQLSIVDDPFYYDSPAQRFFDDEGVEARRKALVDEGIVVGRLNTRETAAETGERPGDSHGLFHRPVPGHTTLVMAPGDWKFRELLEETRRGIMVSRIVKAFVDENRLITLIPEDGWLVERGNIVTPLRFSRIRIRVPHETRTIDARTRDTWLRVSSEKSSIMAEASPAIRITGFVD